MHGAHPSSDGTRDRSVAGMWPPKSARSFMLALIAVFLACFHEWRQHLTPGERGTVMIVAADRKQARVILRYIRGLLTGVPMLARLIERETAESFDLNNSISIEVGTAIISHRSRLHNCCCAARRAGVLAERGQCQSRLRSDKRHPSWHGDDSGRDAALRVLALRPPRRAVGRTSKALRQGRRFHLSLAGGNKNDEPRPPARSAHGRPVSAR